MIDDRVARLKDQLDRRNARIEAQDQEIRELRLANSRLTMRETDLNEQIAALRKALGARR